MVLKIEKKKLQQLYRFKTIAEIAGEYEVNPETIRKRLHKMGIETRSVGPKREFNPGKVELEKLYQKYSMRQIARMKQVGETVVWKRLKEFGIKLRDYEDGGHRKKPGRQFSLAHRKAISDAHKGKWAGEKNPHWKGGATYANLRARSTGEYKQWKIAALALRGNACQQCGVKNRALCKCCGTEIHLHVHHVLSFALHVKSRFDPENSEVLCPKCHKSRHHRKSGETENLQNGQFRRKLDGKEV